ncbi:MAG: PD-(D/E)XK nuclease domain-containing protein, partial [Methanobacteriota archaeon]
HKAAYIIEFKTADSKGGGEKTTQNAIGQIREKEYASALLNDGVMPDMILNWFSFFREKR